MDSLASLCAKKIVASLPRECLGLLQDELMPLRQEYHLDSFIPSQHPPSGCWYVVFEIHNTGCYDEIEVYYYGITSNPMPFLTSRIFHSLYQESWSQEEVRNTIDRRISNQDRVWIEAYCLPRSKYTSRFIVSGSNETLPSNRSVEVILDDRYFSPDLFTIESSYDIVKQDQDNLEYWYRLDEPQIPIKYYVAP